MSVGAFYSEDEKRRVHEESGLRAAGQTQARGASPAKRHDNVAHTQLTLAVTCAGKHVCKYGFPTRKKQK